MLKQDEISALTVYVRTSQIITSALIIGVVTFMAITLLIVPIKDINQQLSIFALVGLLFALFAAAVSIIVPRIVRQGAARQLAEQLQGQKKLVDDQATILECGKHFQTSNVLRCALLEGACFLNLVFFMVDHSLVSMGVAAALILLIATGFPTSGRVVDWIEDQMERVRDAARSGS